MICVWLQFYFLLRITNSSICSVCASLSRLCCESCPQRCVPRQRDSICRNPDLIWFGGKCQLESPVCVQSPRSEDLWSVCTELWVSVKTALSAEISTNTSQPLSGWRQLMGVIISGSSQSQRTVWFWGYSLSRNASRLCSRHRDEGWHTKHL